MINALHLLWIVPVAASVGAAVMATLIGGDCDPYWYDDDHDVSGLIDEE